MSYGSFMWVMPHLCESWLIHMSRDSYEWAMTHSYESWFIHTWAFLSSTVMPHMNVQISVRSPTTEWVMSYTNESRLIWMSHVWYEWVTSHTNECYFPRIFPSCSPPSCPIWMRHVTHDRDMSHIWMNHVSYELCTYVSHIWMDHVSYELSGSTRDFQILSVLNRSEVRYGVATIIWLLKIIGLFCKRAL